MGFDKVRLQQIAMSLKEQHRGLDLALTHDPSSANVVHYCLDPLLPGAPTSAVVELIQALNDRKNPDYRVLERSRWIYTTATPNLMDAEMAAMNGIRLEELSRKPLPKEYERPPGTYLNDCSGLWGPKTPLRKFAVIAAATDPGVLLGGGLAARMHTLDRIYMMVAFSLVTNRFVRTYKKAELQGANIGAVLVSRTGSILAWSLNTKEFNSTMHAEVNLLQSYYLLTAEADLRGTRLYTTLKPCRMCAGMIAYYGRGEIEVFYGQNDAGEDAQGTALDGSHRLHALDGSAPDFKGVKALQPSTATGSLAGLLEAERERTKAQGTIATTLGLRGSEVLMRSAVRTMGAKLAKYQTPHAVDLNDNVARVLRHVEPFLVSLGAAPRQIAAVADYLYCDRDATRYPDE